MALSLGGTTEWSVAAAAWGGGNVCLRQDGGPWRDRGCCVRVHVLVPRGVHLGDGQDHLCEPLAPVLDTGSST